MGIFNNSSNSIDEKRYQQILAEEAEEERHFKRENSFKKLDEKVERKMKEQEEEIVEEYDDTDYDEYSNDYSNFNTVIEDNDKEEIYIDASNEAEEAEEESSYSVDSGSLVDIINSIYKYFAIFAIILAVFLIIYLLIKAKFVAIFLYIIGLVCSFLFGYILMFVVNTFFFKN